MIYPGDDRQAWLRHAAGLSVGWEVGIDASRRIDGEELYWVRATPSAYLLSPLADCSRQKCGNLNPAQA